MKYVLVKRKFVEVNKMEVSGLSNMTKKTEEM